MTAAIRPTVPQTADAAGELWIKICGLRSAEAVEAAVRAGANAVGFVFHGASPRNVDCPTARALVQSLPPGVERVAVFLHPAQSLLDEVLSAISPDWVQTDAEDLSALVLPAGQRVLPVLRGGRAQPSLPLIDLRATAGRSHPRCLFEAGRSGAGERADWQEAARLARRCRLVLAGGLDAANVAEAVAAVRPFGVDVSSGVERERGVKDAARIREFVRAARAAGRGLSPEEST